MALSDFKSSAAQMPFRDSGGPAGPAGLAAGATAGGAGGAGGAGSGARGGGGEAKSQGRPKPFDLTAMAAAAREEEDPEVADLLEYAHRVKLNEA